MKIFATLIILLITPAVAATQNRYDIVIDELMADPAPPIGLPNYEWLELKNTTSAPISLQNWRIGDASGQSGPLPNFTLQPDSFVIVCAGTAAAALSAFGTTISVTSFPSLDNEGDQLFLRAANGRIIHAVSYTAAWYQNELKRDGGWTLEMIDPKSPCAGKSNWRASTALSGGTPGKKNAIDGLNNDSDAPQLKRAYITDSVTIKLVYDEPVDSLSAATLANYSIDGGLVLLNATTVAPLFNTVQLKTITALQNNTVYTVTAADVKDCNNNTIGSANKVRVGLPADAASGDWVINEILFNPRSNAYDFVEFYNNSNKILDASKLFIANRNASNVISSIKTLSATPFYIFPGDYIVETEDPENLALQYLVKNADNVLAVASPPSFPDDAGTVVALNFQGEVVDEVRYKDDWHFKLIENDEAVSLERIDPGGLSTDANNWHSAASTAGYGTPTYKNSQYKLLNAVNATVAVAPKIFSPDNDGRDDIATLQYEVTEAGYIANVLIFDIAGRVVRHLVKNGILGLNGYWNWDGLDEKGNKLAVGTYIIFTEIFNLRGKKQTFKTPIVLARKL